MSKTLDDPFERTFLLQKLANHLLTLAEQTGTMSKWEYTVWGRDILNQDDDDRPTGAVQQHLYAKGRMRDFREGG